MKIESYCTNHGCKNLAKLYYGLYGYCGLRCAYKWFKEELEDEINQDQQKEKYEFGKWRGMNITRTNGKWYDTFEKGYWFS